MTPSGQLQSEAGFTLVELLVVMIIVALLAAIAIPSFFSQSAKGRDSAAKVMARTSETAMEIYSTDHGGSYAGATAASLHAIEPTIDPAPLDVTDSNGAGSPGDRSYRVSVLSGTGEVFWISRTDASVVTLGCQAAARDGCPPNGRWG